MPQETLREIHREDSEETASETSEGTRGDTREPSSDAPRGAPSRVYTCEFCGEEFPTPLALGNHVRNRHRTVTRTGREAEATSVNLGGLSRDDLTQKTLDFAEALDAAAPEVKATQRRRMLKNYDDASDVLSRDLSKLENFLDTYGLNRRQQRQIGMDLFGVPREGTADPSGVPGMEFRTMNTPWGQQVPVMIINQGREGERVAVPWTPGGGTGQSVEEAKAQGRAEAMMESRMEKLEKGQDNVLELLRKGISGEESGERRPPPMRKGYRPVVRDGNLVYDKDGDIAYEQYEEPWEAGGRDTMGEMLMPILLRQITDRREPKEIDEEALALKIKDKIGPREGEGEPRTLAAVESLTKTVEGMQAARETDRLIEVATQPLKEQLALAQTQISSQSGFKGLSDTQAELRIQKEMVDGVIGVFSEHLGGFREDLRPLVLQQAVERLKGQGLGDGVIGQFLSAMREQIPTGVIPESAKREALDRVRQWARG